MFEGLGCVFEAAGFVLCYLALRDPEPVELRDVQARLGIAGLIADRFEQPQASRDAKELRETFGEFNSKGVRVEMVNIRGLGVLYVGNRARGFVREGLSLGV